MLADRVQQYSVGQWVGGSAIAGLTALNCGLLLTLLVGPALPSMETPPREDSASRIVLMSPEWVPADLSLAYSRPLFLASRKSDEVGDVPVIEAGDELRATATGTGAIEFHGIIVRDSVKFAVCRVGSSGSIALYEVGDMLLGNQIIDISRDRLVIMENGKPKSYLLQAGPFDQKDPAALDTQSLLSEPAADDLIIGPGHL